MITPTVGRMVHFYPHGNTNFEPLAAVIAKVWGEECVNLTVFLESGHPQGGHTSIRLVQNDDPCAYEHCRWMPFQRGQAVAADTSGGIMDRVARLEQTLRDAAIAEMPIR